MLKTRIHLVNPEKYPHKLFKRRARLDIRKYSFPFRIIDNWNSLPEKVVTAPSIKSFERRLDKHWKNQELMYDYQQCIKKLKPEARTNNTTETDNDSEVDEDLRIVDR